MVGFEEIGEVLMKIRLRCLKAALFVISSVTLEARRCRSLVRKVRDHRIVAFSKHFIASHASSDRTGDDESSRLSLWSDS